MAYTTGDVVFPKPDYSRVPFALYHDREIYEQEQEKIFRGPTWSYLGLEAEIPNPGDFRAIFVGDTPVVINRGKDSQVYAFVNRCAHRGATVIREGYGNVEDHTCIYHRWNYDLEGNLIGIPFRRGVDGKGGLADDFDLAEHSLRKLEVALYHGVIFGTFSDETEPLVDYLGPTHAHHLARVFNRPVRILGYQRQRIFGNWKLYNENVRDMYHGSLLHEFQRTFGIARVTQFGGGKMDPRHRHNISYLVEGADDDEEAHRQYRENRVREGYLVLEDPDFVTYRPDFDDGISLSICSVFPNVTFQQIRNSLATRQIRTKSLDEFELFWTLFGYADDDESLSHHRVMQGNLVGPAGLISMEDGEAVEIVHRSSRREKDAYAVVEMGGGGEMHDFETHIADIAIRGFWSYYAELMGFEPDGALR